MHFEARKGQFSISTNPERLDRDAIHAFLSQTYWAKGRPRPILEEAIRNSVCFGVYDGTRQVGFARVITDYATFGYLADVYILEAYRGAGLGQWLITTILAHPRLTTLRRWLLTTHDAQSFYRKCGFADLQHPEHHLQRLSR